MRFNHILIITYGRSGSTLLMSLLNTVDGVLIAGENYNVCLHLFRAYKALLNSNTSRFGIENLMFESLEQYIDISVVYDKGEYILWRLKLSFKEDIKNEN